MNMNILPNKLDCPVLIKFGQYEHMKHLQQGKLYMNPLKYFIELKKNSGKRGVGDVEEASLVNIRRHELFIEMDDGRLKQIPISPAPRIVYDEESLNHPVFCMMYKNILLNSGTKNQYIGSLQLSEDEYKDFKLDGNNNPSMLIVMNPYSFMDAVQCALSKFQYSEKHGLVIYRNKKLPNIVDGKWIPDDSSVKDIRFEHQSEFRIEINTDIKKPFVLDIGNIEAISILVDSKDVAKKLSIIQTITEFMNV